MALKAERMLTQPPSHKKQQWTKKNSQLIAQVKQLLFPLLIKKQEAENFGNMVSKKLVDYLKLQTEAHLELGKQIAILPKDFRGKDYKTLKFEGQIFLPITQDEKTLLGGSNGELFDMIVKGEEQLITDCLKKGKFKRTEAPKESFHCIEEKLTTVLVLSLPNFEKLFEKVNAKYKAIADKKRRKELFFLE
ncbi:hypothetical protein ACLOJK_005052 [Asimina triloba]